MAPLRRITLIVMSMAAVAAGVVAPAFPAYAASIPAPGSLQTCDLYQASQPGGGCFSDKTSPDPTDIAVKGLILRWGRVAGASKYQVELSRNQDWTNNEVTGLPNGGTTVAPLLEVPLGLPHETYFWRVRAQVGGKWGPYSAAQQFLREWEAPITVVQTPSSADPTIAWAPLPEASKYSVLFATSPVTASDILNGGGTETDATTYTPGGLVDGTSYYWGVAAYDDTSSSALSSQAGPGCGGSSDPPECDATIASGGPFTYKNPTGGGLTLGGLTTSWHGASGSRTACDATTPCPVTPTFSWSPISGADIYDVSIYLDRDATNTFESFTSEWPTYTPPGFYPDAQPGKPYYWRVDAATCGGSGISCTSPPAAVQTCASSGSGSGTGTGSTPPPAASITGVSVSPAGPSGSQSMQGGTTATVQLTGSNILAGSCVSASDGTVTTVPTTTTTSMSFSYWAPVGGGSVTFQIINPDGTTSAASAPITVASSEHSLQLSAISSFQKRSGPITLTSPANGAVEHGNAFTFNWLDYLASGSQSSLEAKNYHLQVSPDDTFTNNVLDISDIDLTQYTDQTSALADGHYFWRVAAIDESDNQLTWSSPNQFTVNATGPVISIASSSGISTLHPIHIALTEVVHGINGHTVKIVPDGESVSHAVSGTVRLGAAPRRYVFTPTEPYATGGTYDLWVSPSLRDANGNSVEIGGSAIRVNTTATNRNKGWTYSRGWHRFAASGARSGSYVAATAGRTAHLVVAGSKVSLYGCKGPDMGSLTVSVAGHSQTISERQSFTRCGVQVWHRAIPSGQSTVRVTVQHGTGNFDEVTVS